MRFCIFIFLYVVPTFTWAQFSDYYFKAFDKEDGIIQDSPYSFAETQDGYLWIAGENGLWKYNGTDFIQYKHHRKDSTTLANDFVWELFVDSQGRLWAGTYGGGLSLYDKQQDRFINFIHRENDSTSISDNHVRGIAEDSNGRIWVGTNNGVSILDTVTWQFERLYVENGIPSNVVRMLRLSKDGKHMLAATINGLMVYDFENKQFKNVPYDENKGLSSPYLYAIHEDPKNHWWIGTGNGLDHLYLPTGEIKRYKHTTDSLSISHDVVFSIDSHKFDKNKL